LPYEPAPVPRVLKWWERPGSSLVDGVQTAQLASWVEFTEVLSQFAPYGNYIWRGHSRDSWLLEPSLDRLLRRVGKAGDEKAVAEHLQRFQLATRGRRGPSPLDLDENEWWALGQHYGLATPLLDWTDSPYAAAFLAFEQEDENGTSCRAVFGLETSGLLRRSKEITENDRHGKRWAVEIVRPIHHHDTRLVSQAGLFTKAPTGLDLESWIRRYFHSSTFWSLVKILIPSPERTTALNTLNRMNINHLSLFPDLTGSAQHCNTALSVLDYARPEGRVVVPQQQENLDSVEPPSLHLRSRGRPLDAQQLLGISRTNAKLLEIEKRRMAAIGQPDLDPLFIRPEAFESVISLLRSAGIRHTAELEAVIAEVDAESLVALLSELGYHQVRVSDAMPILADFAGASRLDDAGFDKFFTENKLTFAGGSAAARARLLRLRAAPST
jgi:hypothetical protein